MAVITISRQFGAGGKTLAQKLASKLEYEIAHEEIIEMLAEMANLSTEGIRSFEAEEFKVLENSASLLSPKRFIEHIFDTNRKYMDGPRYVSLLRKIIHQIAEKGNTIFIGRGSQFILREVENACHVLLVADEAYRVNFMQETYQLSLEQAKIALTKQGKRRTKLMKLFHHDDYDRSQYYHMVLNMGRVTMDKAVDLVAALAQSKS